MPGTPLDFSRFAERLRSLRKSSGLSLRHVAAESGISATFLSDIELGRRMPSSEVLRLIAVAIDQPASELLKVDPRRDLDEILAAAATPETAAALAKICRGLREGKLSKRNLDDLGSST